MDTLILDWKFPLPIPESHLFFVKSFALAPGPSALEPGRAEKKIQKKDSFRENFFCGFRPSGPTLPACQPCQVEEQNSDKQLKTQTPKEPSSKSSYVYTEGSKNQII